MTSHQKPTGYANRLSQSWQLICQLFPHDLPAYQCNRKQRHGGKSQTSAARFLATANTQKGRRPKPMLAQANLRGGQV